MNRKLIRQEKKSQSHFNFLNFFESFILRNGFNHLTCTTHFYKTLFSNCWVTAYKPFAKFRALLILSPSCPYSVLATSRLVSSFEKSRPFLDIISIEFYFGKSRLFDHLTDNFSNVCVPTIWTKMQEHYGNFRSNYAEHESGLRRAASPKETGRPKLRTGIESRLLQQRSTDEKPKSGLRRGILRTPSFAERKANSNGMVRRTSHLEHKHVTFALSTTPHVASSDGNPMQRPSAVPGRKWDGRTVKRTKGKQIPVTGKSTKLDSRATNATSPPKVSSTAVPNHLSSRMPARNPKQLNAQTPSLHNPFAYGPNYYDAWPNSFVQPMITKDGRWLVDVRTGVYWDEERIIARLYCF